MKRVRERYNWVQITDQYEWLLSTLAGKETAPVPLLSREPAVQEVEQLPYQIKSVAKVTGRAVVK